MAMRKHCTEICRHRVGSYPLRYREFFRYSFMSRLQPLPAAEFILPYGKFKGGEAVNSGIFPMTFSEHNCKNCRTTFLVRTGNRIQWLIGPAHCRQTAMRVMEMSSSCNGRFLPSETRLRRFRTPGFPNRRQQITAEGHRQRAQVRRIQIQPIVAGYPGCDTSQ